MKWTQRIPVGLVTGLVLMAVWAPAAAAQPAHDVWTLTLSNWQVHGAQGDTGCALRVEVDPAGRAVAAEVEPATCAPRARPRLTPRLSLGWGIGWGWGWGWGWGRGSWAPSIAVYPTWTTRWERPVVDWRAADYIEALALTHRFDATGERGCRVDVWVNADGEIVRRTAHEAMCLLATGDRRVPRPPPIGPLTCTVDREPLPTAGWRVYSDCDGRAQRWSRRVSRSWRMVDPIAPSALRTTRIVLHTAPPPPDRTPEAPEPSEGLAPLAIPQSRQPTGQ